MVSRKLGVLLAAVVVIAGLAACGSGGDEAAPQVVEVEARWATAIAGDVPSLVAASDVVFVGTVEERTGQRDEPLSENGRTIPVTSFSVRVEDVLAGSTVAGGLVTVDQAGGTAGEVTIVLEGDTPLETGGRYLFFATPGDNGALRAPPFGRMQVVDGRVRGPAGWETLGAVAQLAGLSVPQAVSEVQGAQ